MPPGDEIDDDYQVQIGALLMGKGTDWHIQSLRGWYGQGVKTGDLDLLGDGATLGVDRLASKVVVLTAVASNDDPVELQAMLDEFMAEWAVGGDKELHRQTAQLHQYIVGRTRRYVIDDDRRHAGIIEVVAEFHAGDPTIFDEPGSS